MVSTSIIINVYLYICLCPTGCLFCCDRKWHLAANTSSSSTIWLTGVRFESWGVRWTSRWSGTAQHCRWRVTKAEDETWECRWVDTAAPAGDCGFHSSQRDSSCNKAGTCMLSQSWCFSWSISIGRWFIWVTHTNQWLSRNLTYNTVPMNIMLHHVSCGIQKGYHFPTRHFFINGLLVETSSLIND